MLTLLFFFSTLISTPREICHRLAPGHIKHLLYAWASEVFCDLGRLGGPKVNVKERIREFYAKTPTLQELGFVFSDDGELCLPFSFDAAALAKEYPDLRKPMLEFEKVIDRLLKATDEHIDKLILGMKPQGAQQSTAE